MSANRHIAVLLICCFSAYLVHNLVPHHHSEIVQSPVASHCDHDHEGSDEHERQHDHDRDAKEPSSHCHAFNDATFQKCSAPSIRPWEGVLQTMLVPDQLALTEENQGGSAFRITLRELPCRSAVYLSTRGLRAPPMYA
jgi:hypothetical protein